MPDVKLINATDIMAWREVLDKFIDVDTYHLPEYHLVAKSVNEGEPYIFVYQDNERYAALPFLVRKLADVGGLADYSFYDATSVYGYPGVLTTVDENANVARDFKIGFQTALLEVFDNLKIITFFSRTNPLFPTSWLMDNIADIISMGKTVAIDLRRSNNDQIKDISKGHKYDISKARKNGVYVIEDYSFRYIDQFILMYNETMNRVNSNSYYFFPKDYYNNIKKRLDGSVRLYFAKIGEEFVSASIFLCSDRIIQYHLSGVFSKYIKFSGAKVILDEIRQWGSKNRLKWLFLGGGLGSDDGLFRFKAGFSKLRLPFQIIRMVRNSSIYEELCFRHDKWLMDNCFECLDKKYFPRYRATYK